MARWIIVGVVMLTPPGFAAHADAPGPTLDDLLQRAEREISEGHVIAPPQDSALETWSQVLQIQSLAPASRDMRKSLNDFIARARSRAADERTAGHVPVAIDFTVFADLATQLLNRTAELTPPPSERPAPLADAPVAPPAPEPKPANAPPVTTDAPGSAVPTVEAAKVDAPKVDTLPPPVAQSQPDTALATFYLHRGDDLLATKDISAARKFYEFAANAGSAAAAATLAKTYEPNFLSQLGVVGMKADPALAKSWYGKAAAMGDQEAVARLHARGTAAAK